MDDTFRQAAQWLLARGVKPWHFTVAQIPVFALEIWAALNGLNLVFVGLIALVIILDGGDGILARTGDMASRTGAVLDASFDTVGIAIVLWGGTVFYPEWSGWFLYLFLANGALYAQNAILGTKVVSWVRGPALTAIGWPDTRYFALFVGVLTVTWLLTWRVPATLRACARLVRGRGGGKQSQPDPGHNSKS